MSELLKRLKKNSTIDDVSALNKSEFFNNKDVITTKIPAFNVALSANIDGGLTPGLTIIAGPSKHFKSGLALLAAKAYLDKYEDAVVLFYDSEFGTPPAYFQSFGIDTSRVLHTPILNIEQLKFDVVQQLDNLKRGDRVIIIIDSVGNLASKKEANDALNQNSAADMTRAKELKSIFRIITPHLTAKDIPMVAIGHIYMTMCLAGDTEIQMADGTIKVISDISEGDVVKTTIGDRTVTETFKPDQLKDGAKTFGMYEIELEDGSTIRCTGNHMFMSNGQWSDAQSLEEGEYLDLI